jgi:hypothetical protein
VQLLDLPAQGITVVVRSEAKPAPADIRRECVCLHVQSAGDQAPLLRENCGIHPLGEATDPEGNAMAAINIRCLEGVDIDAVPLQQFDGRSL